MPENRPKTGSRFRPGQSGNPGGRPKLRAEFKRALKEASAEGLEVLREIIRDKGAPAAARIKAVEMIWARDMGRPPEAPPPGSPAGAATIILQQLPPGTPLDVEQEREEATDAAA